MTAPKHPEDRVDKGMVRISFRVDEATYAALVELEATVAGVGGERGRRSVLLRRLILDEVERRKAK